MASYAHRCRKSFALASLSAEVAAAHLTVPGCLSVAAEVALRSHEAVVEVQGLKELVCLRTAVEQRTVQRKEVYHRLALLRVWVEAVGLGCSGSQLYYDQAVQVHC